MERISIPVKSIHLVVPLSSRSMVHDMLNTSRIETTEVLSNWLCIVAKILRQRIAILWKFQGLVSTKQYPGFKQRQCLNHAIHFRRRSIILEIGSGQIFRRHVHDIWIPYNLTHAISKYSNWLHDRYGSRYASSWSGEAMRYKWSSREVWDHHSISWFL